MRTFVFITCILLSNHLLAQKPDETKILKLSSDIFRWEVENKFDSLNLVLHDKFIAVGSTGAVQNKDQYVDRLKSGKFIHHNIKVEENTALISDNTATVIGKGIFNITVSDQKKILHLSYIEVFTRQGSDSSWKLLALKASVLE
jgi:hypothetical protein